MVEMDVSKAELDKALQWDEETGTLTLPSSVAIDVLPQLIKRYAWLKMPVKRLNFMHVKSADSAILSLILVWAQAAQTPITVTNLPQQLQVLIELYDMHAVMHIE